MARKRERVKNRSGTPRFIGFPLNVLQSSNYAKLNAWSVKLLLDIRCQYNGYNNGDLHAAFSVLKTRGWNSPTTLQRAKDELIYYGYIELSRQGGSNKCNLYALTWESIDDCNGKHELKETRVASHLWKQEKD